jgi:hypothetical protein
MDYRKLSVRTRVRKPSCGSLDTVFQSMVISVNLLINC